MTDKLRPGRDFRNASDQSRFIAGMLIGYAGCAGFIIQIILFPLINHPFDYPAAITSLSAGLGLPIAKLFQHSQKEE